MKNRLLGSLFGLLTLTVVGQNISETNPIWSKLHETNEVLFEKCQIHCSDFQEGVDQIKQLIRVTNKTEQSLKVSWLNALFYDGICSTCESIDEYTNQIELGPNASISGDCLNKDQFLVIFSSDNKKFIKSKLTDLKIYSVTSSIIQKN